MMTCSRRYLSASECGPLRDLVAGLRPVLAHADPPGPAHDLPGDEERGEVGDDVRERRLPPHQIVLVGAEAGALGVGVVLVQVDGAHGRHGGGPASGVGHHPLPHLVPQHQVARVGHLGGGVLRVGVVHVEPGPVGEDDVGQPEVLVGHRLGRVVERAGIREAARVPQRRLLLVVPARPAPAGQLWAGAVRVDHLRGGDHRVRGRLPRHGDAVLHLRTHDPSYAHAAPLAVMVV
jgi:hypothetical protein